MTNNTDSSLNSDPFYAEAEVLVHVIARSQLPVGHQDYRDLVQDLWVDALLLKGSYNPAFGVPFSHYAWRRLRHTARTAVSKGERHQRELLGLDRDAVVAVEPADGLAWASEDPKLWASYLEAIEELPPKRRRALKQHLQGWSSRHSAVSEGISPRGHMYRVRGAKRQLAARLKETHNVE